jgi:hypothetical protein
METLRWAIGAVARWLLAPFSGHNAMASLLPLGILTGIVMLWVFRETSNQEAIGRLKGKLQAHLYEMRLFTDEPLLIWKAQWGLITTNIRYLGRMLVPALVMTAPMVLVFAQLECFYGHAPLAPGREAILTVQMKDGAREPVPALRAPEGIAVESPGVRVDSGRQISWRIRALHPVSGTIELLFPDGTLAKSVDAGRGPRYISGRRVRPALDLLWHPGERRLPAGNVEWIEIRYPEATVHAFGLDLHWLIWLLITSMICALALKKRFRVSF